MVELEAVLKGSLPKPEYEMVEVEVEVTDDEAIDSGEEGDSGDVFGEGSQGDPMQVDGDESSDAGARAVGGAAGEKGGWEGGGVLRWPCGGMRGG